MIARISNLFQFSRATDQPVAVKAQSSQSLAELNSDPYLMLVDTKLRVISVFDDTQYDRADVDILTGPMRRRALAKLSPLGFKQSSGSVIKSQVEDVHIHLPKFRALGASPFDALRDTHQRPQDFVLLTPTQAAAQIIARYDLDQAIELLEKLVVKLPANLMRIHDYLEPIDTHQSFRRALGHLIAVQRQAVSQEPLKTRRALS